MLNCETGLFTLPALRRSAVRKPGQR